MGLEKAKAAELKGKNGGKTPSPLSKFQDGIIAMMGDPLSWRDAEHERVWDCITQLTDAGAMVTLSVGQKGAYLKIGLWHDGNKAQLSGSDVAKITNQLEEITQAFREA